MKRYSLDKTDWFLTEDGLQGVLGQFSHPENERRHYRIYNYQGGKIFIKSFLEKGLAGRVRHRFAPRGKTEFRIGALLSALGIPTPKVLGYGIGKNTSAVVEEYVEGQSFLEVIKKTRNKRTVLAALAELLQQLKLKGVRHNDLHLDNVLMHNGGPYLIDLHKSKIKGNFSNGDEVSNAAHALGMVYDDISDKEREFFFTQYGCNQHIRQEIEDAISRLKKTWVTNKKKRAFKKTSMLRTSGDYIYVKGTEGAANGEFVASLKKDKKVVVERFSDHIRKTYLKPRRLKTAWKNHVVLTYLGNNASPRTFYVRLPTLSSDGYISMEDMGHKGIELDRFLDGKYGSMNFSERKRFIERFSHFFQSLFRQRIAHRDMKACNIFALNDGGFVILDVEDFVFEEIREEFLKRMLVQLNTTVPKNILLKDRMRFFLKLTSHLKIDKKQLFRNIVKESLGHEIVYEGIDGLKRERW